LTVNERFFDEPGNGSPGLTLNIRLQNEIVVVVVVTVVAYLFVQIAQ